MLLLPIESFALVQVTPVVPSLLLSSILFHMVSTLPLDTPLVYLLKLHNLFITIRSLLNFFWYPFSSCIYNDDFLQVSSFLHSFCTFFIFLIPLSSSISHTGSCTFFIFPDFSSVFPTSLYINLFLLRK